MTEQKALQGKRILILEDDFYLAEEEKALLEDAGAEVVGPFGSRWDTSELANLAAFDAAVVDINLGRGPSFDLAHALHRQEVPFIFVTGYDASVIPSELAGAPRIEKPVRERDLIGALVRIVDARRC